MQNRPSCKKSSPKLLSAQWHCQSTVHSAHTTVHCCCYMLLCSKSHTACFGGTCCHCYRCSTQQKMLITAHDHARLCDFFAGQQCSFKNHATFYDHCSLITISTVLCTVKQVNKSKIYQTPIFFCPMLELLKVFFSFWYQGSSFH